MATVQSQLLKLAQRIDPYTKEGQEIQGSGSAVSITGAANNGSGLIRITAANHNFQTDERVFITGVTGTTEANSTAANPSWAVTRISSSTFDLQGSTFTNAYVSGGTATGALVGSVDGDRFTAQRLIDVYNEARFAVAQAINTKFPKHMKAMMVSGTLIRNASFQFASGAATKPTGYLEPVLLTDVNQAVITVIPATLLMAVKDLESSTNRFVFETATQLLALTGTTNIPNASTYILWYYGITNFAWSDVTGNSTVETFNDIWLDLLVEVASGIANEMGNLQAVAFAEKLMGS